MKKAILFCLLVLLLTCMFTGCVNKGEEPTNLTFTLREDGSGYVVTGGTVPEDGHLVIPATYKGKPVLEIGFQSFKESKLTRVTIPDGVVDIAGSAFYGCTELTQIHIPDSVESIGFYAFYGCTSLTEVVIPDRVTAIGGSAFSDCMGLKRVVIGNGVRTIGTKAFFCCEALESVIIGDSVRSIASYAFHKCLSLHTVRMPKNVEKIGQHAFRKCQSLTTVCCAGDWMDWWLISVEGGNEYLTDAAVVFGFSGTELPPQCQHSFTDWTFMDEEFHKRSCTQCQGQATGKHTYEEGICTVCQAAQPNEE